MKTNRLFALTALAVVSLGSLAQAQTPSEPAPEASASREGGGSLASSPPSQVIYSQQLPAVQDLSNAASAQGLVIERVEQAASQITVVYKTQNGTDNTVAYKLLPAANSASSTLVLPTTPAPTIIYSAPPRVVYRYDPCYAYDPFFYSSWYAYPRFSIGIGLGYRYPYRAGFQRSAAFHGRPFHGRSFHGGYHPSRR